MNILKGQIVALSDGEYSDYGIYAHMRALQDFETDEQIDTYKAEYAFRRDNGGLLSDWEPESEGFDAWLIRKGLLTPHVEPDEIVEWWTGAYGMLYKSKGDLR